MMHSLEMGVIKITSIRWIIRHLITGLTHPQLALNEVCAKSKNMVVHTDCGVTKLFACVIGYK